jgi:hypothetical protein
MATKKRKTEEVRGQYASEIEDSAENARIMLGIDEQPAAEIHPPKTINTLHEKGLKGQKIWGWVKISANFIYHIKKLKGAKLAIWQVISLSVDENGICNLTVNEIADLAGYSRSETIESIKELDGMGYLAVSKKSGRKSMYSPNFAARGNKTPSNLVDPSRKTTRPAPSLPDPSSPPIENAHSSIKEKEIKELKNNAGKPAQPKVSDFPELVLFKNLVLTYCKPHQRDLVINAVREIEKRLGHFPTEEDLRPFWDKWRPISGNAYNLTWLTEWAVSGVIPSNKPAAKRPDSSIFDQAFREVTYGNA